MGIVFWQKIMNYFEHVTFKVAMYGRSILRVQKAVEDVSLEVRRVVKTN